MLVEKIPWKRLRDLADRAQLAQRRYGAAIRLDRRFKDLRGWALSLKDDYRLVIRSGSVLLVEPKDM
jgi:hypothetical protein